MIVLDQTYHSESQQALSVLKKQFTSPCTVPLPCLGHGVHTPFRAPTGRQRIRPKKLASCGSTKCINFVFHSLEGDIYDSQQTTDWWRKLYQTVWLWLRSWCRDFSTALKFPECCPGKKKKKKFSFLGHYSTGCHHGVLIFKSKTWLTVAKHRLGSWSGGWGWHYMVIFSVFRALIMRHRSAAASTVLESCDWALGIDNLIRTISSTKSGLLSSLSGFHLDWWGCVPTP